MLCREKRGREREKKKLSTKAKPGLKDWLYFSKSEWGWEVTFVHIALCKSTELLPWYKWGYKKALANSTGKLSLGEGPAQTGRAGLGFPARGLGSLHCVYVAEVGLDFHCASLPFSHENGKSRLHLCRAIHKILSMTMFMSMEVSKNTPQGGEWGNPLTSDLPNVESHLIHAVYTKRTHAEEKHCILSFRASDEKFLPRLSSASDS